MDAADEEKLAKIIAQVSQEIETARFAFEQSEQNRTESRQALMRAGYALQQLKSHQAAAKQRAKEASAT